MPIHIKQDTNGFFSNRVHSLYTSKIFVCGWYTAVLVYKQCVNVVKMTKNFKFWHTN